MCMFRWLVPPRLGVGSCALSFVGTGGGGWVWVSPALLGLELRHPPPHDPPLLPPPPFPLSFPSTPEGTEPRSLL